MIRVFKHYVPTSLLVLGLLESVLLVAAADLAWIVRSVQMGSVPSPFKTRLPELFTFASILYLTMLAVGFYHTDCYSSLKRSASRLLVSLIVSEMIMAMIFFLYPVIATWRSVLLLASFFVFFGILLLRAIFRQLGGWHRFRRRVLVMGAGQAAEKLVVLAKTKNVGFKVAQFIQMSPSETRIGHAITREDIGSLAEMASKNSIDEVILAMDERRGSLPVASLLEVKMAGIQVSDLPTFLERETGRVDIDSLNPSWMIFSDGFNGARQIEVVIKRAFDIAASSMLLILTCPILLVTALIIKLTSPGPIFYRQQRVGQSEIPFDVLKFRSMRTDAEKDGKPQFAQQDDPRVTRIGRFIRAARVDEIPQIFNVLRGDMSFVGPRPERPYFVSQLTQQIPYFAERHIVKPGITGWAQINYPYGASFEDSRAKLEYDLYYVKNYSLFLDLLILLQTVRVVLWQDGVR